jgi:hypothetical protein
MNVWHPAGCSCWGKPLVEDQPKADFLVLLSLPVSSYLSEGLYCHGVKLLLLVNSGLMGIPDLRELMFPPCRLIPSPVFEYASCYVEEVLIGFAT